MTAKSPVDGSEWVASATRPALECIDTEAGWPTQDLERVPTCPLCGGKERQHVYSGLSDADLFGAPGHWTLYECQACHAGYLDPRPTPDSVGRAYERYYTHDATDGVPASNDGWSARLFTALVNGYSNWRYGTTRRPATRLGILVALCLPQKRSLLDRKFRHWPPERSSGAKLLDVGLGSGAFMELAQAGGWTATGVDLDHRAVKNARAKGLDAIYGGIETLATKCETFDYITISHVIEHVYDPVSVLECAYRLLKPGGRIWIETPNWRAVGRRIYGRAWRGLEPPRHLVLFTWDTLGVLLERAGFRNVEPMPVRAVTSHVFQASDALERGLNPYQHRKGRLSARLRAVGANIHSRIDYRSTEFITLTADK